MSEQDIRKHVERYLSEARIMQLATDRDGQPWICNLHFAVDGDSNMYWLSKPTRRHSEDIVNNPRVAVAIAVKTNKPVIGIQATGVVQIVTNTHLLETVMGDYRQRHGTDASFADQIIAGTNEHKLYQFSPDSFNLFDEVNFATQPLQKWVINK